MSRPAHNPLKLAIEQAFLQSDSRLALLCLQDSSVCTYIPPEDLQSQNPPGTPEISPIDQVSVFIVFLQRLVFLSTNNLLHQLEINRACDWIVDKGGADVLIFLCASASLSMKIFARKVFCSAVESGNIQLASRLIQSGTTLNSDSSQSERWTELLSAAVIDGNRGLVEVLCKAGVPPEIKYNWRQTFDWQRSLPGLQVLLTSGADPETFLTAKEPGFPLVNAALAGSLEAVRLLVNSGARVDLYLPKYKGTALQAAASRGHTKVAIYLIQSKADVNIPSPQLIRCYPLHDLYMGDDKMIPFRTPVQLAAKMNNIALLQTLLEHGASATACPISTHPDFEDFCQYQAEDTKLDYRDFPRPYDEPGPYDEPYERDYLGYTPLQYGALSQNMSLIALLLSTGVSPDARIAPDVGDTPLQISARLGNFEIFRLLRNSGADVNAPPATFNGRTAVQGAAESGDWRILCMLQRVGAQINAPAGEEFGMTALQAACFSGHSLMVGFLFAHQANLYAAPSPVGGFTPIQAAAMFGDIELMRAMISLGAEVNAPASELGATALLAAMQHESLSLLRLLVENGANVNTVGNHELESPLRQAAFQNWFEGVEYLLECGAHLDGPRSRDFDDELTPLGCAIDNSAGMVDLMLQHGADVLAIVRYRDIYPLGALTFALFSGSSIQILDLLFAKVQDIEKHTGWEDALSLALIGVEDEGFDLDICKVIIEKLSPLPPLLRYKVLRNGWDALPPYCLGDAINEEKNLLEAMALLIEAGVDLDCHAKDGSTVLQRMARCSLDESCRFLVADGANVIPSCGWCQCEYPCHAIAWNTPPRGPQVRTSPNS